MIGRASINEPLKNSESEFFRQRKVDKERFLVVMRLGDTPVLIPNTMVKTKTADGTVLETVWESRWLPE